jgi:hypothetical protein
MRKKNYICIIYKLQRNILRLIVIINLLIIPNKLVSQILKKYEFKIKKSLNNSIYKIYVYKNNKIYK